MNIYTPIHLFLCVYTQLRMYIKPGHWPSG